MKRPCEFQHYIASLSTEFSGRHNDGMCGDYSRHFCVTCNRFLCKAHLISHESHYIVKVDEETGNVIR